MARDRNVKNRRELIEALDSGNVASDIDELIAIANANDTEPGIGESMANAVEQSDKRLRKDGKPWGSRERDKSGKRITPKMRLFASLVAQGNSPKEAYRQAYNASNCSDATVYASSNKLMSDPRISVLMEAVWTDVHKNIVDDAIAIRRHVMDQLLEHSKDTNARLNDRLKSLELLGRSIGLFTDKTESKVETVDADQLKRELEKHLNTFDMVH
jgi:hypothetical protein